MAIKRNLKNILRNNIIINCIVSYVENLLPAGKYITYNGKYIVYNGKYIVKNL